MIKQIKVTVVNEEGTWRKAVPVEMYVDHNREYIKWSTSPSETVEVAASDIRAMFCEFHGRNK